MRIVFYGRPADRLGKHCEVVVPSGKFTVSELRRLLAEGDEVAADVLLRDDVLACLDDEVVPDTTEIHVGQNIAFFSVLSGG